MQPELTRMHVAKRSLSCALEQHIRQRLLDRVNPTSATPAFRCRQLIDFALSGCQRSALQDTERQKEPIRAPLAGDPHRGLLRQGHCELVQQKLVHLVRPGVAWQDEIPAVGGGQNRSPAKCWSYLCIRTHSVSSPKIATYAQEFCKSSICGSMSISYK